MKKILKFFSPKKNPFTIRDWIEVFSLRKKASDQDIDELLEAGRVYLDRKIEVAESYINSVISLVESQNEFVEQMSNAASIMEENGISSISGSKPGEFTFHLIHPAEDCANQPLNTPDFVFGEFSTLLAKSDLVKHAANSASVRLKNQPPPSEIFSF